jgi:thiamine pyrophosphokinase
MSSHHIIREDQEPALLMMDATIIPFAQVQELLEWSPTVMVAEAALTEVLRWGIKIDVVLARADKIPALTSSLQEQFPLKLLSYDKQEEALSTALHFLIEAKQKAVNIIAAEPLESFEAFSPLDISVFQSGRRWSLIRQGVYEKWLPAGSALSIYPANGQPDIKTLRDGVVTIQRETLFWVSEINEPSA